MAQKENRNGNTDTADNDENPLGAENFIDQQPRSRAESQVVAVVNNRKGIWGEKTEQQRKQDTTQNNKNKGAENILALKIFIDKEKPGKHKANYKKAWKRIIGAKIDFESWTCLKQHS